MLVKTKITAAAVAGMLALAPTGAYAAALTAGGMDTKTAIASVGTSLEQVQYRPGYRGGPIYYHGGPSYYRGGPSYYRGGPGPGWGHRAWYRRPYYGTIIGGIALGALIVTAYNVAPPRPRPDLCWYWSDSNRTRGYWDYC